MIINQVPFNPETAKNGDVLVHRAWGPVVYIGQHPAQKERYVVWDSIGSCFRTVLRDSLTKEVETVEKWMNIYDPSGENKNLLIHSVLYPSKEAAEANILVTRPYLCTVSIMVPKV
jgi:hypothetical protein